jgi:alkylhydroperoxidase family enzyme
MGTDLNDAKRAWIQVLGQGEETAELLAVYDEFKIAHDWVDNILSIHSLSPDSLRGHMQLYRTVMFGKSPLSRLERETIAVTVSTINECHY